MKSIIKKVKFIAGTLVFAMAIICFTGCKTNSDETPQVVPVVTIPGGTPAKTGPKNLIIDGTEIAYSSFVAIPAGSVTASKRDANAINGKYGLFRVTTRTVTIPSFNMGAYEVTQRLYKAVMTGDAHADSDPSICKDGSDGYVYADNNEAEKDLRPVDNVTWFDAVYFCNKLSEKTGKEPFYTITELTWTDNHITAATVGISTEENASKGYRLPFDAEWEYAARGANPSGTGWGNFFAGKASSNTASENPDIDSVGWYTDNSSNNGITGRPYLTEGKKGYSSHRVGLKNPVSQDLGLYDMSGNVIEWCYDWYDAYDSYEYYYTNIPLSGPSGDSYNRRVFRGGSWKRGADFCSVVQRDGWPPETKCDNLGFRICCSVE